MPPPAAPPAVRPLALRKNFAWTFAGNLVGAASRWGVVVVLAKLGSPTLLGQFALAMAVSMPIVVLCMLQLRPLQVTDVRAEHTFGRYLGLRLVMMAAAVAAAGAIGFARYGWEVGLLVVVVAVNLAIIGIRDVFFGAMQKHERMDFVSIGKSVAGVAALAAVTGAFLIVKSLPVAIGLAAAVRLVMLLTYDRKVLSAILRASPAAPQSHPLRPSFEAGPLWSLTKQALPLGVVMMIISAQTQVPRYFVEAFEGQEMLGYFAAVAALLQVGMTIVGALGQSASPRLAKYYRGDVQRLKRLLVKLLAVGGAVGAAGVVVALVLGRAVLRWMFAPEYARYNDILVLVMAAGAILYVASFLGFTMTAARYLKIQLPINLLVLLVTVVGSWLLIGRYGLYGAAVTIIAAAGVRLLIQAVVVVYAVGKRRRQLRSAELAGVAPALEGEAG